MKNPLAKLLIIQNVIFDCEQIITFYVDTWIYSTYKSNLWGILLKNWKCLKTRCSNLYEVISANLKRYSRKKCSVGKIISLFFVIYWWVIMNRLKDVESCSFSQISIQFLCYLCKLPYLIIEIYSSTTYLPIIVNWYNHISVLVHVGLRHSFEMSIFFFKILFFCGFFMKLCV